MKNILKTPLFPQFVALFSHPFYTFFKRIFEQSGLPVKARFVHLLECIVLLLALLRLASFAIQLNLGYHLSWDPVVQYFASQPQLYDRYLLACLVCYFLYTLIINWQLFLRQNERHNIAWQCVAYDLTVRNADQAQQCHRLSQRSSLELNQVNSKPASLSLLFHTIKSNLFQAHLDIDKLRHPRHQLTIFTFLSVNNRKKLLQFDFLANFLPILLIFIDLFPFLLGLTLLTLLGVHATVSTVSLPGCFLLLSDLTLLWIIGFLLLRNAFLLIYFETITSLAIVCHLQAGHRLLAHLMAKGRSGTALGLNTWNRLLIKNFLTEHAQICTILDASNQQFISLAIFSAYLLNAPANIYLIYRLVYRPILPIEITAIFIAIVAQLLALACGVLPLALANGALYQTGKYLPGVQLSVLRGERSRSLKLKYEILQNTLTESRVKSGASFGPVCLITFESIYQVVTLYAAYMLVLFDLLPK